jgi:hypothetical protein
VDPHSGKSKPFAGYKFRLLLKLGAFLGYLQKQQGAILTLARNAHLRPPTTAALGEQITPWDDLLLRTKN